jgi:hypothetical protein
VPPLLYVALLAGSWTVRVTGTVGFVHTIDAAFGVGVVVGVGVSVWIAVGVVVGAKVGVDEVGVLAQLTVEAKRKEQRHHEARIDYYRFKTSWLMAHYTENRIGLSNKYKKDNTKTKKLR